MPIKITMYAENPQSGTQILDFALSHGAVLEEFTHTKPVIQQSKLYTRSTGVYRVSKDVHTFQKGSIRELSFQKLFKHHKVGDVVKRDELSSLLEDLNGGIESKIKGLLAQGVIEHA